MDYKIEKYLILFFFVVNREKVFYIKRVILCVTRSLGIIQSMTFFISISPITPFPCNYISNEPHLFKKICIKNELQLFSLSFENLFLREG